MELLKKINKVEVPGYLLTRIEGKLQETGVLISKRLVFAYAAILAILMKNSPLEYVYNALLTTPVAIQISKFIINKPLF